jgi:hypothetical protein
MNENEQILQAMVEYYRNKCSKLEHDFLVYKINSQRIIQTLNENKSDESSSAE